MVKAVLLLVSVILSITVKGSSLQCYVCYDCAKINNEYVQSCDSLSPPSNSTTTPSPTSTPATVSTTSSTEAITSTTATTNTTTEPSSTTPTTEPPRTDKTDANYECFKGKINVNGSDVIIRGCAVGRTNETCEIFGLTSCSFCNSDKCNSAASIELSALLLAVFFLTLVKE